MPEHRAGTPGSLTGLESFLWNDFEAGPVEWQAWVGRKLPDLQGAASSFHQGMLLHGALRSLEATNNRIDNQAEGAACATLNRLIAGYCIAPRLGPDGALRLVPGDPADPVARLVVMALEAMQTGVWHRFKLCREPICRTSYYDASKAGAKTWCSMETCGSRNKMRRYRARS